MIPLLDSKRWKHTHEYPTPAPRPGYSLLDNQKLFDTFGLKISNWQRVLGLALDS